jgi:hypothetical protein
MLAPCGQANDGPVEILLCLDATEPPAGRLLVVPGTGPAPGHGEWELHFTGWLGLLRALYEVMGSPASGSEADR